MPNKRFPRSGSMQFWPRVRSKRAVARVRSWPESKEAKALGFGGYKVGMASVTFTDNRKNSLTKGQDVTWPVTIIECPPLKVAAYSFYKLSGYGSQIVSTVFADKLDKELARKIPLPKKAQEVKDVTDFDDVRLLVYTQPKLTGLGKKKPELFELAVGGSKEEKLAYVKEMLGKEITVNDVFKEGEQFDAHVVTKGKGFQGPVKRFGIKIRQHKSEKTKRGPGSLGGWKGHGHFMYRIAHAGQMGYHPRVDCNKWVMKVVENPDEVNIESGYKHYGVVKNSCVLVRGTVSGSVKRMVKMTAPMRPNAKIPSEAPEVSLVK